MHKNKRAATGYYCCLCTYRMIGLVGWLGWRSSILDNAIAASVFPGLISMTNLDFSLIDDADRSTSMRRGGRTPLISGSEINSLNVNSPTLLLDVEPSSSRPWSNDRRRKFSSWARTNFSSFVNAMSHSHSSIPDVQAIPYTDNEFSNRRLSEWSLMLWKPWWATSFGNRLVGGIDFTNNFNQSNSMIRLSIDSWWRISEFRFTSVILVGAKRNRRM